MRDEAAREARHPSLAAARRGRLGRGQRGRVRVASTGESRRAFPFPPLFYLMYSIEYVANAHSAGRSVALHTCEKAAHAHTKAAHVRSASMKAGVPNGAASAWSATLYRTDLEIFLRLRERER